MNLLKRAQDEFVPLYDALILQSLSGWVAKLKTTMSLHEFMAAQGRNADTFDTSPHFTSLVPLVDRMYEVAGELASQRHSPTLVKLLMMCRRDFLIAAGQIQRALPFDSHANTRRAVEIARVALAFKRNPGNTEEWLRSDLRQRRWDARQEGRKPDHLPPARFPELDGEPLLASLQQYIGIASDSYIHFTPEFYGQQTFSETAVDDGKVFIALEYFTAPRDVLFHAVQLCGLHVRILLVFDAVFDSTVTADPGWNVLRTTFEPLAQELMQAVPKLPPPTADFESPE